MNTRDFRLDLIFEGSICPLASIPKRPCSTTSSWSIGGGKRRLFAIANYVNQFLLYPVHDCLANLLRGISLDGTFNQRRPLGLKDWSCELPSSRNFASAVVNERLATKRKNLSKEVCFVTGQKWPLKGKKPKANDTSSFI